MLRTPVLHAEERSAIVHRPVFAAARITVCAFVVATALASSAAAATLTGRVTDMDLHAIADAVVSVQATGNRTRTAADGTFELPGVGGVGTVITAAAKGFFTGSTTLTIAGQSAWIAIRAVPQDDDPTYRFVEPAACGSCHPDQLAQWTGSPMSGAGTNAWVHDLYDGSGTPGGMGGFVYVRDSVLAPANPESECASCHQPESWIADPFSAMLSLGSPSATVGHGVSCEVCHKIADIDESRLNFPGIYPGVVTFTRPASPEVHQVQYGLLADVDFSDPSAMRASYQPQLASEVCAACHQDTNDHDHDGDFEDAGSIVSEPTYGEWEDSPYGDPESPQFRSCVDCHMPASGGTRVCNFLDLGRDPASIRSHDIRGTTAEYLEQAAELTITPRLDGATLHVDAVVTNTGTGHHVPTGVTIRNMILLVEVDKQEDGTSLVSVGGQTVHDLGGIGDPADGYYAGLPGKLYAKVIHDALGRAPTFFTDAAGFVFDNRIAALDSDTTEYSFAVPPGGGTLRVRARLIYRRSFRALVDAKGWTDDGHGEPLEDLTAPHYGHLMAEATRTVLAVDCGGKPAGTPCADGDPCNGDELCDGAGNCAAGINLDCDDSNTCTDDACVPGFGCANTANTAPCDDGNACTSASVCAGGTCAGTAPLDCDDGNACTTDTCASPAGCTHAAAAGACDDGDACTIGDLCVAAACSGGAPPDCTDGDPCTRDGCDSVSGCVHDHEPATGCLEAAAAALHVRRSTSGGRIRWRWQRGNAVDAGALGDPSTTTAYALCIYDESPAGFRLATRLDPAVGAGWRFDGAERWTYRDSAAASDGISRMDVTAGPADRSAAAVVARGSLVPVPSAFTPSQMFEQQTRVVAQLFAQDPASTCWTSSFEPSQNARHDRLSFKAGSP